MSIKETRREFQSRAGFTLVELLVVIGIIALLVGILIPVAKGVRTRGYEVRTKALIAKIASGCHAYYNEWRAYPGIIDEGQISTSQNYNKPPSLNGQPLSGTGGNGVTCSENLVLSLLGGLAYQNSQFQFVVDSNNLPQLVRVGAQSLNPADPKQYQPYIEAQTGELSTGNLGMSNPTMHDSNIPEFMDGYYDPKPIIYMRARAGAKGVVNDGSDLSFSDPQYDPNQMMVYTGPVTWGSGYASWFDYLRNPGLTSTTSTGGVEVPRGRDAFVLISAGADRNWGTRDDVFSGE